MGNPVKTVKNIGILLCLTFSFAQEDSTVVDLTIRPENPKIGEAETVTIKALVNPIGVAPTAYRFSIYPRNHPAEPFMQKLFFPGESIQIILPANILNPDTLGNMAKLEPLGSAYDHQYRMFDAASGEINLTTFDILVPADIIKLTILEEESGNPIPTVNIRITQIGEILSKSVTDTSGYSRLRIPVNRSKDEPVLLTIDTGDRFPTWKGRIEISAGIFEKTVNISSLNLEIGETIYEVFGEMVPFRGGPENGAALLFFLNEGDQVIISKVAGDRLYGRVRIFLERQDQYQNIFGWILEKHVQIKDK